MVNSNPQDTDHRQHQLHQAATDNSRLAMDLPLNNNNRVTDNSNPLGTDQLQPQPHKCHPATANNNRAATEQLHKCHLATANNSRPHQATEAQAVALDTDSSKPLLDTANSNSHPDTDRPQPQHHKCPPDTELCNRLAEVMANNSLAATDASNNLLVATEAANSQPATVALRPADTDPEAVAVQRRLCQVVTNFHIGTP